MAMPPRGGITASRIAHLLSWSSSRVTAAMTRTRCMPERRPALLRRSAEVLHSIGAARAGVGGRSGRAHLRQHLPAALALVAGGNLARKSVVEGKSVSVRLDLGGRRNIKKKQHNS